MKQLTTLSLLIILLIGAFVGCQSQPENTQTEATEPAAEVEKEAPRMYQPSELAQLMRKMYEDNQDLKTQVENGEIPESFPEDFYKIHSAIATNPDDIDDTYKAFADAYLASMERIVSSDSVSVKGNFNNMVNNCVNCHQVYCQGPIPKIKKLTIAE